MEESDNYKRLSKVMYAMTLDERKKSRDKWQMRGFKKVHSRGKGTLFNYWKNRLDSGDAKTLKLLEIHWENYVEYHKNPPATAKNKKEQPKEQEKQATPSLWTQAKSLGKAVAGFAKDGFNVAPEEVVVARMDACRSCDKWDSKAFGGMGRCTLCGCNTIFKTKMPREKCPIDKWLPVT
jgi:hypothetical protein